METLKTIIDFFQNEILGMSWLNRLIGRILNALGLDTDGKIGRSVQFFIYDIIKIMVLLGISKCSDVCRYFRNNSYCRGSSIKGSVARRCSLVYDGSYYTFTAVADHAPQSCQAKAYCCFYNNMHYRNNNYGIFF